MEPTTPQSTVRIVRHPIHPMLVPLPIGLWIFSVICDLAFAFGAGNETWKTVALYTAAGGVDSSYHMKCMAADFYIPGVPKSELIAYAMRQDSVGGLGCYPGRSFIHVDVRDRPRGWSRPVTFSGC